MANNLKENLEIIKEINSDDSNFILKVIEVYKKNKSNIDKKKSNSTIITKGKNTSEFTSIIDLDTIWAKPYFYTRMKLKIDGIVNSIEKYPKEYFSFNAKKVCKEIIFNTYSNDFACPEDQIDIVDFIKTLDSKEKANQSYTFIAKELNEETLFKEQQLKKSIEIINISDHKERIKKIYEETCSFLDNDFISNNYCDFKNNKCVSQRHFSIYNLTSKNGCCFTYFRTCPNLSCKKCTINCLPCKLYSCPYLTKRGIGYYGSELILFQAFLTKDQRKHFIFDFYEPEEKILNKID